MKKISLSLALLCTLLCGVLLTGCEGLKRPKDPNNLKPSVSLEVKKDFPLEIDLATFNQTAQNSVLRAEVERVLFEGTLQWNLKEICEKAGFQIENLKQFEVEEVTIKSHIPADYNVGFFRKLTILSGKPLNLFAQSDDSNDQNQITFTIQDRDILKLLKNNELAIKLVTTQKVAVPMVEKLVLKISFKGKIKIMK